MVPTPDGLKYNGPIPTQFEGDLDDLHGALVLLSKGPPGPMFKTLRILYEPRERPFDVSSSAELKYNIDILDELEKVLLIPAFSSRVTTTFAIDGLKANGAHAISTVLKTIFPKLRQKTPLRVMSTSSMWSLFEASQQHSDTYDEYTSREWARLSYQTDSSLTVWALGGKLW